MTCFSFLFPLHHIIRKLDKKKQIQQQQVTIKMMKRGVYEVIGCISKALFVDFQKRGNIKIKGC